MKILTIMEEIERIIYNAPTLYDMQKGHIKLFESKKNFGDTQVANKLREYVLMTRKNSLESLAWKLRGYRSFIKNAFDGMGIQVEMSVRTKDYIGFLKKSILYVMKDKQLAKLMDEHGFRWTVGNQEQDDEMSHNLCDMMVNMSLLYFSSHGWIILEAEPTIETNFDKTKYPNVHITEKDLIFSNFEENVKNYKKTIKENGYQRVHFYVKSPEGILVEGQVGTYAMDRMFDEDEHDGYEDQKYKEVKLKIDSKKIKTKGFEVNEKGVIIKDPDGILVSRNLELEK